ncbi:MAG TPA: ATP-binding protein [Ktedonobacteraceae bacterium]|nr:ATP-binding protein [Ktedonobacteraceae bacterium]
MIPAGDFSRSNLGTILNSIADAVWIYDAQGHVLQMNNAAQQLIGVIDKNSYLSLDVEQRLAAFEMCDVHGNPMPREQWGLLRILNGEVLTGANCMMGIIRTFDGRKVYLSISGSPLRDEHGQITGAITITRDITERELMVLQLREVTHEAQARASRLEAIIESMVEGVIVYDRQGNVLQMNAAAQQLFGIDDIEAYLSEPLLERASRYQSHDAEGRIILPEDSGVASALRSGVATNREVWMTLPDGRARILRNSVSPILIAQNEVDGAVIVSQDITEPKSIERQKSEFLSIASHELRTPITALQGFSELLQMMIERGQSLDTPRTIHAVKEIIQQSQRLTRLIEDMLEISRIETGRMPLQIEQHDLLETLKHSVEVQATINKHHTLKLAVEGLQPEDALPGHFDRDRIEQVLNNLIGNAAKYSPAGSEIEIGLRYDATNPCEALLWVKDAGVGIANHEVPHIFKRFHRASNLDRSISGFGIGLYLVHEFVTRHGGRVWVESVEGSGSTFYVSLPLPM